MTEAIATVGDIDICYETFGDPADPPLLMIMGLGGQLITWPEEFCQGFADRHFFVIRYDNRDIGLTSNYSSSGPTAAEISSATAGGESIDLPYSLSTMAADAIGLLDAIGVDRAHMLGISMGGMIAQLVAIEHADRCLSLTSIMSNSGEPDVGQPTPEALVAIGTPGPSDRDGAIGAGVDAAKIWASPEFWDPDLVRARLEAMWDRGGGSQADNTTRQLGAIIASGPRAEGLAALDLPTLVIHGDADTLITPSGGERTAELIPGAELLVLEGMGHDLAPIYWQAITEGVLQLAIRAASTH